MDTERITKLCADRTAICAAIAALCEQNTRQPDVLEALKLLSLALARTECAMRVARREMVVILKGCAE